MTPRQQALWANRVMHDCLMEAGDDVDAALSAADIIIATQPFPDEVTIENPPEEVEDDDPPSDLHAFFAYDIFNRRAQGVLNRSLQAAKGLSAAARKDLATALKRGASDSGEAILKFIDKYRLQLARLLSTTQLASLLEGAREVATNVPALATFPGAVPPPPSLEPREAVALVERLSHLTVEARAEAIYKLPADQQVYAQQALAAKDAGGPVVPPTFTPPAPPAGSPEGIHFPTIDEAVKQLAEKNVMTRDQFDALDAAAKAKSFAVAGVDAEDTLTKIRDVLAENVRTGADYETFKSKLLESVDEDTFLSEPHMETVFRTNVQAAFSDGQMVVLNNPLVRSGFPYADIDAIHDDRVEDTHLAVESIGIQGTNTFRISDPVFQTFRPPWRWQCRCSWTPLTVRQAAEKGIKEAQQWLETGVEPSPPAFVPMPDFQPPPGFRRAVASAPLSIQLSMQSIATFAVDKKPEEETDESLLMAGGGPPTMGALDTAKEPRSTKIERRDKKVGKSKTGKRTRSLFKRLRVRKKWTPSVSLAVDAAFDVGGQWITIGGHHDPQTGEKHVGGFKVKVDGSGRILTGRMRGKKVSQVKSTFDKMKGPGGKRGRKPAGPAVGTGGGQVPRGPQGPSGRVAVPPPRPSVSTVGPIGQGGGVPPDPSTTGGVPPEQQPAAAPAPTVAAQPATRAARVASLAKVNKRLDRYTEHFRAKGLPQVVEWMDALKEHINEVGTEEALAALGAAGHGGPTEGQPSYLEAQYEGGYEQMGDTPDDSAFLKAYLNRAGVNLLQSGMTPDPNQPIVSSMSPKEKAKEGGAKIRPESADYIPSDPTFINKLVESQHLPGLESSEDIHKLIGKQVTQLTPDVLAKLDETYGQGKWIIKSYGAEAFAGFGILFPEKVAQIQQEAKKTIYAANKKLAKQGFELARDSNGKIIGITGQPKTLMGRMMSQRKMYKFEGEDYNQLDENIKRWVGKITSAAKDEGGARLPGSPEQELRETYKLGLRRDVSGKVTGVVDAKGQVHDIGTPGFKAATQVADEEGHWAERAISSSGKEDYRFMVQPAFPAVGVTEEERAAGLTWETAKEGRCHVTVRNGKASVVPYATFASRGDGMPAVFANKETLAMEKAAQDAIDQLPESERTGQLYAPDILRTADGWKVIELNPSTEGGGSLWLGENPFTIDALVSQMTNREPAHARFIKRLLMEKKQGAAMAVDFNPEDHPRRGEGTGGGQFVQKGAAGGVRKVRVGKLTAKYATHTYKRISGPSLKLHNYKQHDDHSCGFVAALTVTRFFKPSTSAKDVLSIVRPKKTEGIDGKQLRRALRRLGVEATYTGDLTIAKLRKHVEQGTPVLVTVYPDDYSSDHWVVVQGFDEADDKTGKSGRIYLTNYKSLPIKAFEEQWFETGDGLICKPIKGKALAITDVPPVGVKTKSPTGTEAVRSNLPEKVSVTNGWGKLRAVVVGRLENDVIPRWYPTFDGKDHNEVDDPRAVGKTKAEYDPEMYELAVEQTEDLCKLLESEGVQVIRPPLVSPEDAQAEPVGLGAEWAREVFSVFGDKLTVNQPRAAHRNKDQRALEPFFAALEQAGKAKVLRLPPCDWERRDNDLKADPRPFLEGGDVFRFGKDVLVTMSYMASSPAGYRWLADLLAPDGIDVWPAYMTEDWEHGDYILCDVREGLCIAYLGGFVDGILPAPITDWDVIELTKDEADKKFAANGLVLRDNVLLLPKGCPRVVRALEKKGVDVIEVAFDGPMYWQGALDCATNELWRE